MAINIAPKSLDTDLSELMRDVASGKAQLPEFQRSWTWDDNRIIGILASLDPVALDQACVDLVYKAKDSGSLIERIESRNGIHTLEHAEKIGFGSRNYRLVEIR